jgi:hypothetical protein
LPASGGRLMSVILTSQFNRSEIISAASKMAMLQQKASEDGCQSTRPRYRCRPLLPTS